MDIYKNLRIYQLVALFGPMVTGSLTSIFCAVPPMIPAAPPTQDLNFVSAVPCNEFIVEFNDLVRRVKEVLGIRLEGCLGGGTVRVDVIYGMNGSKSSFNTTHQTYMAGEWLTMANDPRIHLRAIPVQLLEYLDRQVTEDSCRYLTIPKFRLSGLKVVRRKSRPNRAYIIVQIAALDRENDFIALAKQIDSMLPAVPRESEVNPMITMATIIPFPHGRRQDKCAIEECEIDDWQRKLTELWNQMLREKRNCAANRPYEIDHFQVSYWAPLNKQDAQAHGIDMASYFPRPDRFLCKPMLPRSATPPMPDYAPPLPPRSETPRMPTRRAPAPPRAESDEESY